MAAIFEINGSGRLWKERNLYQGDGRRSKIRRGEGVGVGVGVGERRIRLPEVIVFLRNSVRPRKEFLISAVKLQLSIASQMCPLDSLLLRQNAEDGKLIKTS